MNSIIRNSVTAWQARVQLDWTLMRRVQEIARHFRVRHVMTKLSKAGGMYKWELWFKRMHREEPGDPRGTATSEVSKDAKNKTADELVRVIEGELGFGGEDQ